MDHPHATTPRAFRRHRGWVSWSMVAIGATVWSMVTAISIDEATTGAEAGWLLAAGVAFFVVMPIAAIVALSLAHRTWRASRRRKGRFTRSEKQLLARQQADAYDRAYWWSAARVLASRILDRQVPPSIDVWEVARCDPGERFFHDGPAGYARYYGTTATYQPTTSMFVGAPAFVAAGVAVTALGNAAASIAAQHATAERWREASACRVIVSNRRLVVQTGGRWLSFFFSGMVAVYPDVDRWALVCQFHDCEPLMISGPSSPAASVMAVYATHGADGLERHPALAPLRA